MRWRQSARSAQCRARERDTSLAIRNATIAVPTRSAIPPPTMAAVVNPPIKTVMAIQMKPAMKPPSSALMMSIKGL